MKIVSFITLVVWISWLGACSKPVDTDTSLNISLHDCAEDIFPGDGGRLCFDAVVEDSRCPANVTCIWGGVARARFTFSTHSVTHIFTLSTINSGSVYRRDTTLSGYKIEFLDLTPYPLVPPATPPSDERKAKVKITKL